MREKGSAKKINKKRIIFFILLCLAGSIMMTACKVSGNDPSEGTDGSVFTAEISVEGTAKEPTESAAATTTTTAKATQKVTVTPAPSVKETTAATTAKPSETTAPAATTKATAAPAAATKAPVATTAAPVATTAAPAETTAAPLVETAALPVATTAAPATDYTAMCAEIRSKLIVILEVNGQWDPNFTGTITNWGQKWWEVGYFDDFNMSIQDVADEYYTYKLSGTKIACGIDCYVADGKIYLDYQAYVPA